MQKTLGASDLMTGCDYHVFKMPYNLKYHRFVCLQPVLEGLPDLLTVSIIRRLKTVSLFFQVIPLITRTLKSIYFFNISKYEIKQSVVKIGLDLLRTKFGCRREIRERKKAQKNSNGNKEITASVHRKDTYDYSHDD